MHGGRYLLGALSFKEKKQILLLDIGQGFYGLLKDGMVVCGQRYMGISSLPVRALPLHIMHNDREQNKQSYGQTKQKKQ